MAGRPGPADVVPVATTTTQECRGCRNDDILPGGAGSAGQGRLCLLDRAQDAVGAARRGQVSSLSENGERVIAAALARSDVAKPDQVRGGTGRLAQCPAQPGGLLQPRHGLVQPASGV